MGLFGGGNSSSSSTVNNYDQRSITETNTENDGEFSGNAGTLNYSVTDGGAFDFAENLSGESFGFAENLSGESFGFAENLSGEAFDFAGSVVDALEKSNKETKKANSELFSSLAKQQSEILTSGQAGIIDTLSKNFKWVAVAAATAYAISRLKA